MRVEPSSLRVRLGQGDAFGPEDGLRFALPGFRLIRFHPSIVGIAAVMTRLNSERQLQLGTGSGEVPAGFFRAPEFGSQHRPEKEGTGLKG